MAQVTKSAIHVVREGVPGEKRSKYRMSSPDLVIECLRNGTQATWDAIWRAEGALPLMLDYTGLFPSEEYFGHGYLNFPGNIHRIDGGYCSEFEKPPVDIPSTQGPSQV